MSLSYEAVMLPGPSAAGSSTCSSTLSGVYSTRDQRRMGKTVMSSGLWWSRVPGYVPCNNVMIYKKVGMSSGGYYMGSNHQNKQKNVFIYTKDFLLT